MHREISQLTGRETASSLKNAAVFVAEVAAKLPALLLPYASLLLSHLNCEVCCIEPS